MSNIPDAIDIYGALEKLLLEPKKVTALVVGDLILDEYLYGSIERISPEAPVGVLDWRSLRQTLGGAANVANNLVHLGCEVFLAGVVGKDDKGQQLCQLASDAGIRTAGILFDPNRPTTSKIRIISHGHQLLRVDKEVRTRLAEAQEQALLAYVLGMVSQVDGIILSDYAKGVLGPKLCQAVISAGRAQGIPVLVDPKGEEFSKYRGATLLTPNKAEVQAAAHMPVQTEAQLKQAVESILTGIACDAVLVTRGAEGMSLYQAGSPQVDIKAEAREVFDITGAGDTVVAMLGRVLFAGHDLVSAAQLANIAAGIKIGKFGTAVVATEEVLGWLRQRKDESRGKIIDQLQLKQIVSRAHSQNKTVVFTNGCFDLLHVGHIQLLQRAKALGDMLVVAINDDDSVRKLKGEPRPVVSVANRARIIAALECVDYVTIFSDLTPLRLIEELRPDVLVKGADYTREEVVGQREVEKYGGRVELVPIVEGQSTSEIVRNVALRYRLTNPG